MVRPVLLRRVGVVVALLGIGCLLVALVLPWQHFAPGVLEAAPVDISLLLFLQYSPIEGYSPAPVVVILYLLPVLGACVVAVEALRAGQGRAATRAGSALLLLGMSCALFGLAATPALVQVALGIVTGGSVMPWWWALAGAGGSAASLGFGAALAGGVLLAVGALLHRWTLRRNARHASATTTGQPTSSVPHIPA